MTKKIKVESEEPEVEKVEVKVEEPKPEVKPTLDNRGVIMR